MNRYVAILQEHAPSALFELDELVDQSGVLTLRLVGTHGSICRVSFDGYVAYRKIDEGDAMALLAQLAASATAGRSFYRVEESDFVEWVVSQSYGVREPGTLTHYAIVALNDIVDVVSLGDPVIRME